MENSLREIAERRCGNKEKTRRKRKEKGRKLKKQKNISEIETAVERVQKGEGMMRREGGGSYGSKEKTIKTCERWRYKKRKEMDGTIKQKKRANEKAILKEGDGSDRFLDMRKAKDYKYG